MALKVLSALETSKITVPTPSATTDAATKGYVDDNAGGGTISLNGLGYLDWVSLTEYVEGDVVISNDTLYRARGEVDPSMPPPYNDTPNWESVTIKDLIQDATNDGVVSIDSKTGKITLGNGLKTDSNNALSVKIKTSNPYLTLTDDGLSVKAGTASGYIPVLGSGGKLNASTIPLATIATVGGVIPDGTTIKITSGVISVVKEAGVAEYVGGSAYNAGSLVSAGGRLCITIHTINANRATYAQPGVSNPLTGTYSWVEYLSTQQFTYIPVSTNPNSNSLANISNNWLVEINSDVTPGPFVLPTITPDTSYDSYGTRSLVLTHEMIVCCKGESGSVSLTFSGVYFLENGSDTISLERGYNHFLVFRNFPASRPTDINSGSIRQWVGNIQGKVPLPSQS